MSIDKEQFLTQPVEGAFSTSFVPVPENEYLAKIPEGGVGEPEDKLGEKGWSCWIDLTWGIVDEEKLAAVVAETGKEKPTIRQRLFLDVLRDADGKVTGLDGGKGKNVGLGQIREAVNQNDPRKRWTFKHLEGQIARIRVIHDTYQGRIMANVAFMGVTKA